MSSKIITIEDLFNGVRDKSRKEKEKNINFDSQKFWQGLKPILENSLYKAHKWKHIRNKYYDAIMKRTEFEIDGEGNRRINEGNHFAIQTVRIPRTKQPSLKKIMQVALNAGEYHGYQKWLNYINAGSIYSPDESLYYYINKKEGKKKLTGIMTSTDIATLTKLLS